MYVLMYTVRLLNLHLSLSGRGWPQLSVRNIATFSVSQYGRCAYTSVWIIVRSTVCVFTAGSLRGIQCEISVVFMSTLLAQCLITVGVSLTVLIEQTHFNSSSWKHDYWQVVNCVKHVMSCLITTPPLQSGARCHLWIRENGEGVVSCVSPRPDLSLALLTL